MLEQPLNFRILDATIKNIVGHANGGTVLLQICWSTTFLLAVFVQDKLVISSWSRNVLKLR